MKRLIFSLLLFLILPVIILGCTILLHKVEWYSFNFMEDIPIRSQIANVLYDAKLIFIGIFIISVIFFKRHNSILILVLSILGYFTYLLSYKYILPI